MYSIKKTTDAKIIKKKKFKNKIKFFYPKNKYEFIKFTKNKRILALDAVGKDFKDYKIRYLINRKNIFLILLSNKGSLSNEYIGKKQPHNLQLARIISLDGVDKNAVLEVLNGNKTVKGYLTNFKWARSSLGKGYLGPKVNKASDIFNINDIIR